MRLLKPISILLLLFAVIISCNDSDILSDNNENEEEPEEEVDEELEWQLVWSDEFDTAELDTDKWSFQYGTGESEGLTGWGNNELQYYTDREENLFIDDGKLNIVAHEESYEGMNYTSARIRTKNKGDWRFGRIEIRAQLPEGQGIWPAIWMLPTHEVFGGWPKSGEIDIMELVGHEPETIYGTVHYGPDWPNNKYIDTPYSLDDGTFSDKFYTFSIEWERNQIKWFVDDQLFNTITPTDLQPENYPFNEHFHLLLNLAVGGNWPGSPDADTEFPQKLVVDYIRVYQLQ